VIWAVVGAVVVLVAVAVVLTRPDSEPGVYDAHGITFRYPEDWHPSEINVRAGQVGSPFFEDRYGIDGFNAITIQGYRLSQVIGEEDRALVRGEVEAVMEQVADQADGRITVEVRDIDVPGFIAFESEFEASIAGQPSEARALTLILGDVQYGVVCQWTDQEEAVRDACEQLLRTIRPTD
jgi:hypothetical protein